jgi:twitching motility two-component system response regulator PilH
MKRVLIIDDDPDFADSVSALLEQSGHQVLRARDGDEGVALAAAEKPDVILCDVVMKERTEGFFAIQRLRRTPGVENTPIMVISSVYESVPFFKVAPDRRWLGHNAFMRKPVNPEALLRMVELAV